MQRFALLGAGFIGSVHAANLAAHPDVDFALVYDIDHGRGVAVADAYGATAVPDLAAAFDPEAIDAVFIASSTDTHAAYLRHAADAGVAAMCEKPIDLDLRRATDVVRYATERSARVMVDFNRRFDRDYAELKSVVDSDDIGETDPALHPRTGHARIKLHRRLRGPDAGPDHPLLRSRPMDRRRRPDRGVRDRLDSRRAPPRRLRRRGHLGSHAQTAHRRARTDRQRPPHRLRPTTNALRSSDRPGW
jgi:hypothetical protein